MLEEPCDDRCDMFTVVQDKQPRNTRQIGDDLIIDRNGENHARIGRGSHR